jgi:hypothetical protein
VSVPQPCHDEEIPQLVLRLESVSKIRLMAEEVSSTDPASVVSELT